MVKTLSGLSWDAPARSLIAILVLVMVAAVTPASAHAAEGDIYIVQVVDAVVIGDVGGTVIEELPLIDGYVAELTAAEAAALAADPAVFAVTPDSPVRLTGWDRTLADAQSVSSLSDKAVEADTFWNAGYHGNGVDVALIDSGVADVSQLKGRVVHGPDISFESQNPLLLRQDTMGHGTHLAGIIAGRDSSLLSTNITTRNARKNFVGVAPEARIVSVKVASREGITDVSQVIAAIDWVVQHRNDNGLNIRVLNLSFGTDSTQDYLLDPLMFAAEQAWNHGIVVVVAAGNDGNGSPLRNPAADPFVIAVGASNGQGTTKTSDDRLASFSSCGDKSRHVDLVAPGKSVLSLVAPGSKASTHDTTSGAYIPGSGTSQAAAFVSGAAALVIDRYPNATPDQVKALLMNSTLTLKGASEVCQGAGQVNLRQAYYTSLPKASQNHAPGTGSGSLDASRGTFRIAHNGSVLDGEQDIMGNVWDGASWSSMAAAGASWSNGTWNGASWSGASWSGASWSGMSWSGASWSGMSWSGASWSGASWSGMSWSGASWSTGAWLGLSWNGPAGAV